MKGKATKQVARYTPGPLEVVPWGGGKFAVRRKTPRQAKGEYIAMFEGPNAEADAILYVHAPELLTALKGLFEQCAMIHKHWGEGCNRSEADKAIQFARELTAEAAKQEPKPTTESEPKERWLISTTLHLSRVEERVILHIYDDEQKARADFESIHYGDPIRLCKIVEEK